MAAKLLRQQAVSRSVQIDGERTLVVEAAARARFDRRDQRPLLGREVDHIDCG